MKTLHDKVVVITGAGSGIGRALAVLAAGHGSRLALSDVDLPGLEETAVLVTEATGHTPRIDRLDVRDRAAMGTYAADVAEDLGRVNVVINNAGIALHGDFEVLDYPSIERIMDVDFWGVVHGSKEFLPFLIASGDGHLVNISSLFGLLSVPGQSAYNAAKFAVRGFTESVRQEMLVAGHRVQVSCVHPGGIKTAIARNAVSVGRDQAATAKFFDTKLARTSPERAAEVIIAGVLADKPRILVGSDAKALDLMVRTIGPRYQNVVARTMRKVDRQLG